MKKVSKLGASRREFLKSAAATAAFAAVGGLARSARGQSKEVIKIGQPTILSGRVARLGESSRNGAQLAIDGFNAAGGLNGRMLQLVTRDSKGRPDEAARVVRELINTDKCSIILDSEASSAAFAVQEVIRQTGTLCMHACSETTSLTADPKIRAANAFRCARQDIHDSIAGGQYAAQFVKQQGLKRWMICSPDYAYGRDVSALFFHFLKQNAPSVEVVSETWPKLFAPDYTENITKILQVKPQALYSALYGGDLVTFIDQGNLYGLFEQLTLFDPNMADYTTLEAVKKLPKGIHSGDRYLSTFPATKANADWAAEYQKKFNVPPINWSWQNYVGMTFIIEAMKKTGSVDSKTLADAIRGMTIDSPFGADGKITMRTEDQTIINYAIGWGVIIPNAPYLENIEPANWNVILELEKDWKKKKGYI
jgi:branched-chain amino acid transport system substrate-binding protein